MRSTSIVVVLVLLCGCAGISRKRLGSGEALGTEAEIRLVTAVPVVAGGGRVHPRQVVCAEPSPDIAKAISEAKNLGSSFAGTAKGPQLPADIDLKTALALSSSHAEAVAQMTNRLATIQLLRDGLYRACEAYQNGAISDTTYAVMLSRFDKAMVTMLMGELTAGNFGQSLATLATSASGSADSSLDVGASSEDLAKAQQDVDTKQKAQKDASDAVKSLPSDASADTQKAKMDALVKADDDLADAQKKLADVQKQLQAHLAGKAQSKASGTAKAVGASPAQAIADAQGKRVEALRAMQQKYLENINFDPLVVTCLTAFDRRDVCRGEGDCDTNTSTALLAFCDKHLGSLLDDQQQFLREIVRGGSQRAADGAVLHSSVRTMIQADDELEKIRAHVRQQDRDIAPASGVSTTTR